MPARLLALSFRSAFVAALSLPCCGALAQDKPAPPAAEPVPTVVTRPLSQVVVHAQSDAPADVRTLNETRIAAEIAAPVVEINARPGETLAKGAVVARLDPRDYELAVQRAQAGADAARARLQLAQTQLARSRELAKQSFISSEALNQRETEVDVVRADLAVQEAQVESAKRNLAKTVLRAPFRAIVTARTGNVGELAQPGTPLVTLVDAD
ncbi:MAG TPA: efflux RND transporter periplasmic adaptor subunit, partial [Casimicrobiaceae bacterium]|nr:efflux RND transporter periplasmic adaptor subunit [Casimicrobiaceae bacterium]